MLTYHLEESQVGNEYVVKVDFRVEPGVVELDWSIETLVSIGDDADIHLLSVGIYAAGKSTAK